MGLNRQMRRRQERQQVRDWKAQGRYGQILSIQRNGITEKDLDAAFNDGYQKGYGTAATSFFRQMYAAIAKEMHEAGNSKEQILTMLHNVDHRFAIMFDADEEIDDVFNLIGVRINVYSENSIDRISEVKPNE